MVYLLLTTSYKGDMKIHLYEHREEADHNSLNLTLRALLFGNREAGF